MKFLIKMFLYLLNLEMQEIHNSESATGAQYRYDLFFYYI